MRHLKPIQYPDSMTVRIVGIVFIGFLFQVLLDNILPTLHQYYESQYGGSYTAGFLFRGDTWLGYLLWVGPVAFYSFTLPGSKLFQGILFTTVVLPPLLWYDYHAQAGLNETSETIHIFRYAFFSVPIIFMLHLLLPSPDPLPDQGSSMEKKNNHTMGHSRS